MSNEVLSPIEGGNPLIAGGGSGEFINLPAGSYQATLAKIKPGVRKKHESNEMENILRFVFTVDTKEGKAYVNKTVTPYVSENSNLYKFVRMLNPAIAADAYKDRAALWNQMQLLTGKQYIVVVAPGKSGKGTNLLSALPMPGGTLATPVATAPTAAAPGDDIPF